MRQARRCGCAGNAAADDKKVMCHGEWVA
jgi:hypothetical protein